MPASQDLSSFDDPDEIAMLLVRDNGLDRARQIAVEGTAAANEQGNLYGSSVWREGKRILRDLMENPE